MSTDAESNVSKRSLRANQALTLRWIAYSAKTALIEREKRTNKDYQVMCKNREFDSSILKVCEQRNALWAMEVEGRTAFTNDLHSEDAVYHQECSANFRTCKDIPQLYDDGPESKPNARRGRPSDIDQESAFLFVENYLEENDDEQTTINDLLLLMQEHLKHSSSDAFTSKWLENSLTEHFKDEIVFTEINGKQNVVTFRSKAKKHSS